VQEALERAIAEFEQFRLHLPEAFVEIGFPSFHVTYMNQVARAILGYTEGDLAAGIHGYTLLDERSLIEVMDVATKHMAASTWIGKPYEREPGQRVFQLTLIRKDGTIFPADVQGSYILDEHETPIGVRYIFRDTTAREIAELERARLAAIVASSDDAIISRALDGVVLSWNAGAERLYGYSADEIVGGTLDQLELPGYRDVMMEALALQAKGEPSAIEVKRRTKSGSIVDVSISLFPVRDSRGEIVAVGSISRDIGGRIHAAAAQARSNDLLATVAEAQALFIRERNEKDIFVGLLPSILRLTNSEYGFIGQVLHRNGAPYLKTTAISDIAWDETSRKFYDDNIADGLEFTNLQSLFGYTLRTGETIISNDPASDPRSGGRPGGHPPLRSFMGIPIRAAGRLVGMVGLANREGGYTDEIGAFLQPLIATCGTIFEAISIDGARKEAQERLNLAMLGADLALWELDVTTGTMSVQFAKGGSLGSDLGEAHDTTGWMLERIHPEDRPRLVEAYTNHAQGRSPIIECEQRVLGAAGEYRWMLTRGMVVSRSQDGKPLRAAGTLLDITSRKLADEERERLEQQVRQSQKLESLGVFAGGIAHDFNNLLTAVLGNLFLLERQVGSADAELVIEARHAAERGADLVRRLLTFARPEVEKLETVDLDRLVAETGSLARSVLTPTVRLTITRTAGPASVQGSWTSLQQVLMNLLLNARDAMPEGGTLTVARRSLNLGPRHRWAPPELPRGRYQVISVSDTGAGMPPDVIARIFDPFFTTKDIGRGSGLGLSTALGIARAHGGWLAAESTAGKGSTFRLLLPDSV
jgi:PAS domain S-box-containing protein